MIIQDFYLSGRWIVTPTSKCVSEVVLCSFKSRKSEQNTSLIISPEYIYCSIPVFCSASSQPSGNKKVDQVLQEIAGMQLPWIIQS